MSRVIAIKAGIRRAVIAAGLRGTKGEAGEQGAQGLPFQVDDQGLLANRSAFDAESAGFSYLAIDTGELYFREGAAGNWSAGVPFQGPAGDSAYQVAVANGFVGTEVEWLAFLQGDPGSPGAPGANGRGISSAVIDVGGHLIISYTDATQADLGLVVGADGVNGTNGVDGRGIASMAIDGSGHLIITYDDTTTEDAGLIPAGGGGAAVWGGIGGTLADQADLQAALASKATSAQGALADTAVQPATLTTALAGKVDKDGAKVLSDENYTSAEKSKLAGLESSRFKGLYASLGALQAAHPTASAGDYADVDAGVGSDTIRHVWDVSDAQWQPAGSGAPITAADVKTLYESNPDTNAYTDAEKTKLGTVASNATANPDTDSLTEGATNKWFTVARVLAAVLSGLSVATGGAVVDTDTVLQAIGKLQKQITDLATAVAAKMTNPMTTAGDIIVGDVSGAPARVAKGTDGQVFKMVAGSPAWGAESGANWGGISGALSSQADLKAALDEKAGQNLLINGDFAINQRAFAGGALAGGAYGHDRWGAYNGGANYTVSSGVVTLVSGAICQTIEAPGLAGVPVTVSIDSPSAAVTVHVGSGANYATGTIASGAGRRSLTLTVPVAVTGDVKLRLSGAASFSRVKLERGATATAWQDMALGLSRIQCCRYFYAFLNTSGVVFAAKVVQTAGVAGICNFDFPARMRALPAVTSSGIRFVTTGGTATTTDAAILTGQYAPGTLSAKVNFDSFVTLPNPSNLVLNTASSHVSFDAELACTD
ncbi:hypothetical protein [Pseudomonas anguilliseptica]|uniref:hypothetical protein n=1 Tax=Pseudomonas anguilliseptica TaxID=53406 RepID=UPI0022B00121|nr:hypothetical protein [Pseudomonas anguilliseptica]MCZ4321455.1 hypothetical protein [Pseudomonas anguilliseptica]